LQSITSRQGIAYRHKLMLQAALNSEVSEEV